ncbi:metallophosphoesterase family protein [Pseudofrankia inefficax]|nr:metallophosphoesterase family protein [Pseudofrankia inefficax]
MTGYRIGLLADTHIPEAGDDLPAAAYAALAGCDQILHCGDLHTIEVVDRLERLAPTLASRGNGDPYRPRRRRPGVAPDPRVRDVVVLDAGGLRIGMTHDLGHTEGRPDEAVREILARTFGGPVDLAVSGHSHVPTVWALDDGTALVNPGSPTMPYGYLGLVGTVGILDIGAGGFEVAIHDLRTGREQLRLTGPGAHPFQRGPRPVGGR